MKKLILVFVILINTLGLTGQVDTTPRNLNSDTIPNNKYNRDTIPIDKTGMQNRRDTVPTDRYGNKTIRDTIPGAKYGININRDTLLKDRYGDNTYQDTLNNKMNKTTRDTLYKNRMGMNRDSIRNNKMRTDMERDSMYKNRMGDRTNRKDYDKNMSAGMDMKYPYNAGVIKQNGKVHIVRNGKMKEVKAYTYLPRGIKIMSDGTVIKKDGTTVMLQEGDFISRNTGEIQQITRTDLNN